MKEKIKKILKVIKWKQLLIAISIIYVLIWLYFYLAILYTEHKQETILRIYKICSEVYKEDLKRYLVYLKEFVFKEFTIKHFFFKPVTGGDWYW